MRLRAFTCLAVPMLALVAATPVQDPPAAPAQPDAKVELLEAGASPRHALRLTPTAGLKQEMVTTTEISQVMTMNGMDMPAPEMPQSQVTMTIEVTGVAEGGDISSAYEITKAELLGEVDPMFGDAMQDALKGMVGTKGTTVINSRGLVLSSDADLPADLDPGMAAQMHSITETARQLTSPFPEEEIGVGGKWRVTQKITQNGMVIDQVATYELVGVTESGIEVKVAIEQSAKDQTIDAPGMEGATVNIKTLASTGEGRIVLRADRMAPDQSESKVSTNIDMAIDAQGMQMDMQQTVNVKMTIKSTVVEKDAG